MMCIHGFCILLFGKSLLHSLQLYSPLVKLLYFISRDRLASDSVFQPSKYYAAQTNLSTHTLQLKDFVFDAWIKLLFLCQHFSRIRLSLDNQRFEMAAIDYGKLPQPQAPHRPIDTLFPCLAVVVFRPRTLLLAPILTKA